MRRSRLRRRARRDKGQSLKDAQTVEQAHERWHGLYARPEDLGTLTLHPRNLERFLSHWVGVPLRLALFDDGLLRSHAPRQRGIARKVDSFLDGDDRGHRQLEELVSTAELTSGPNCRVREL